MQKFVFSKTIYAKNMREAELQFRFDMDRLIDAGEHPVQAVPRPVQVARKPPYEKPNTVYYSVRNGKKGFRLGAVMLYRRGGLWHRGVCIVGDGDHFNGEEARRRCWQRAEKAADIGTCSEPVMFQGSCRVLSVPSSVVTFLKAVAELPGNTGWMFGWKSDRNCVLSPYEQHLIAKRGMEVTL